MARPAWLADAFAYLMVMVSLYCVGRLVAAHRWRSHNHDEVTVAHALMGLGMAGMLVPRWDPVPDGLWEALFGVVALWFLAGTVRSSALVRGRRPPLGIGRGQGWHSVVHLVMTATMLYMYWVSPTMPRGSATMSMGAQGGPAARYAGLTLVLIAALFASAVAELDAMAQPAAAALAVTAQGGGEVASAPSVALAPRLERGCHICMCVTMGYMLVLML